MDSDGSMGELLPIWMGCRINMCEPIEVAAGHDLAAMRHLCGHRMAFHGGIDKRTIAASGPGLDAEMERLSPVVREGGFIPSCDHAIPPDVTWPAFVRYCEGLARLTGWL